MTELERLSKAGEEMEAVLKKYDLAGHLLLSGTKRALRINRYHTSDTIMELEWGTNEEGRKGVRLYATKKIKQLPAEKIREHTKNTLSILEAFSRCLENDAKDIQRVLESIEEIATSGKLKEGVKIKDFKK